jgi:hypothetical protein
MPEFEIPARQSGANRGVLPSPTRRRAAWLLASGLVLVGASHASGENFCKPTLTIKEAQLSEMQPPTQERTWTATVVADASRCAATAGTFEVGFSRSEEGGPEVEFHEKFIWSVPSVKISVDFSASEAVAAYWIHSIQACPCAK